MSVYTLKEHLILRSPELLPYTEVRLRAPEDQMLL